MKNKIDKTAKIDLIRLSRDIKIIASTDLKNMVKSEYVFPK